MSAVDGAGNRAPLRVLVANDPPLYRDVLSSALAVLRPGAEVTAVCPSELNAELARQEPDIVVCSTLTPAVPERCPNWILLYPDGSARCHIAVLGEEECREGIDFATLNEVIERVARRLRGG